MPFILDSCYFIPPFLLVLIEVKWVEIRSAWSFCIFTNRNLLGLYHYRCYRGLIIILLYSSNIDWHIVQNQTLLQASKVDIRSSPFMKVLLTKQKELGIIPLFLHHNEKKVTYIDYFHSHNHPAHIIHNIMSVVFNIFYISRHICHKGKKCQNRNRDPHPLKQR